MVNVKEDLGNPSRERRNKKGAREPSTDDRLQRTSDLRYTESL